MTQAIEIPQVITNVTLDESITNGRGRETEQDLLTIGFSGCGGNATLYNCQRLRRMSIRTDKR